LGINFDVSHGNRLELGGRDPVLHTKLVY